MEANIIREVEEEFNLTREVEEPQWNSAPAWTLPGWVEPVVCTARFSS